MSSSFPPIFSVYFALGGVVFVLLLRAHHYLLQGVDGLLWLRRSLRRGVVRLFAACFVLASRESQREESNEEIAYHIHIL